MCAVYIKSTVKDFVICTFHKKLRLFYDLSSAFLPWRRNRFFGPGRIGVFGLIFDRVERVFWCLNTYEEAFKREEGKMNDDNKYLTLILILIWFVDSVNEGQGGKVFKKCINFRFCQVSFSFTWLCFSSCTSAISSSMISALNSARRSRIGLGSVALAMNGCWKMNKKSVKYIEIFREIKRCQESKENSNFSGKLQHELISRFFSRFLIWITLSNWSTRGLCSGSLIRQSLTKSQNSLDHFEGRSKNGGSDFWILRRTRIGDISW